MHLRRLIHLPLALAAILAIAAPASAQQSASTTSISVDSPTDGSSIANGTAVDVGGWAADPTGTGTGVDEVKVYLDGTMEAGGTLLGSATYGASRPDVASALGSAAVTNSGYDYAWTPSNLSAGQHILYVYAHSPSSGWWSKSVTIAIGGTNASSSSSGTGGSSTLGYVNGGQGAGAPTSYQGGPQNYAYAANGGSLGAGRTGALGGSPYMGGNQYPGGSPVGVSAYGSPYGAPSNGYPQYSGGGYPYAGYPTAPIQGLGYGYPYVGGYPGSPYGYPGAALQAPTGLTASAAANGTATLSFTPAPGAASYVVQQSTGSAAFAPVAVSWSAPTTATVGGLAAGVPYSFEVVALDAVGNQSPPSAPATLTGQTGQTIATAPTGLVVGGITPTTVTLAWQVVPGAVSYRVLQSVAGGPFVLVPIGNILANTVAMTGLMPGTPYQFQVVAVDVSGNTSPPSVAVPVVTAP